MPFIFLIWFTNLYVVTGQIKDLLSSSCSRYESRIARTILQETVYSLFEFAGADYPAGCPLDPAVDVFRLQEAMKIKNSDRDWECHVCGKRFVSEHTIDMHMHNRHGHMAYAAPNATCLSAFCPLLRCSVLLPDLAFGDQIFWDAALCNDEQFQELRKQCQLIVTRCTVGMGPKYQRLREWLNSAICSHLSCDRHWEVPDGRLETSVWQNLLFGFVLLIGLLIYYAAIFVRLSSPSGTLRVSSLSSPHYREFLARQHHKCRY